MISARICLHARAPHARRLCHHRDRSAPTTAHTKIDGWWIIVVGRCAVLHCAGCDAADCRRQQQARRIHCRRPRERVQKHCGGVGDGGGAMSPVQQHACPTQTHTKIDNFLLCIPSAFRVVRCGRFLCVVCMLVCRMLFTCAHHPQCLCSICSLFMCVGSCSCSLVLYDCFC